MPNSWGPQTVVPYGKQRFGSFRWYGRPSRSAVNAILLLHSSKLRDPVRSSTINSVLAMAHSDDLNRNRRRLCVPKVVYYLGVYEGLLI